MISDLVGEFQAEQPPLRRALKNLSVKSTQLFNDCGLWTLQIGVSMLNWWEEQAATGCEAPLVLIPALVERRARGSFDCASTMTTRRGATQPWGRNSNSSK
ncbi:DUF4011 domain-containing protein [Nocardia sp. NPDC059228]|uniref:DUF4011 domain-containing protein n=1 Tax=Nocardia sp. NPDC059228 TaxID=3346777 RepID=UPI003681F111